MIVLAVILLGCLVYAINQIRTLEKGIKELRSHVYAERGLVWHFINNSKALAADVSEYREKQLLVSSGKYLTMGELQWAFYDKMRFQEWLDEVEPFDYTPDTPQDLTEALDEKIRGKILSVLSVIQLKCPNVIAGHYAEWIKKEDGYSFYSCLAWLIPEVEAKLMSAKVVIPDELIKLKEAVVRGELGEFASSPVKSL